MYNNKRIKRNMSKKVEEIRKMFENSDIDLKKVESKNLDI